MSLELRKEKRHLYIKDMFICEHERDGSVSKFDTISNVHWVDVTFGKFEKNLPDGQKEFLGDAVHLHFINAEDYFSLKLWMGSFYALTFFKIMDSIDKSLPLTLMIGSKVQESKIRPSLFIYQKGEPLPWNYKGEKLKELPPIDYEIVDGKTVPNSSLQQLYFMEKVDSTTRPELKMKNNPFPYHPIFKGIVGNDLAGNYFKPLHTDNNHLPF
jgi:hypothetical protein